MESEGRKRPRRFSQALINEEKERLNSFREIFRDIIAAMQHKNYLIDANGDIQLLHSEKRNLFSSDLYQDVLDIIKQNGIAPLTVG